MRLRSEDGGALLGTRCRPALPVGLQGEEVLRQALRRSTGGARPGYRYHRAKLVDAGTIPTGNDSQAASDLGIGESHRTRGFRQPSQAAPR